MISIRQVKAARALLGWSQADLARRSGISEPTVARLEAVEGELGGERIQLGKSKKRLRAPASILSMRTAAVVAFVSANGKGRGEHRDLGQSGRQSPKLRPNGWPH